MRKIHMRISLKRMRGCIRMSEKLSKICGILTVSLKNVASFASYPTSSPPKAGVKKEEKKRRKKSSEVPSRLHYTPDGRFRKSAIASAPRVSPLLRANGESLN